jgi:toxin CptA
MLLRPGFSPTLAGWVTAAHLLPVLGLALADLPATGRLLLFAVVLASLFHHWRSDVLRRGGRALVEAHWSSDGRWTLRDGADRLLSAELSATRLLHPQLVVLNFACGRFDRRSLVLFADALDADTLRRLRAELRLGGRGGGAQSASGGEAGKV